MKAEISHFGYNRRHRYSGVYQQQGRMLSDRDWNEFCDIIREQIETVADEAIGTGVPRRNGLLILNKTLNANSLLVSPGGGGVAAGGLLGISGRRPGADKNLYLNQRDLPKEVWSLSGADNPLDQQPLLSALGEDAYLYVDIWDRVVTVFEGDEGGYSPLFDPALHGADTCFRKQRMVQIKAAKKEDLSKDSDPCHPVFDPSRIPQSGNAKIEIEIIEAVDTDNECDPCADDVTIERAVSNHLFRVETHRVEFDNKRRPISIWLKWSNDNGSRELRQGDMVGEGDPTMHSYEYFSNATEHLSGMPSDDWVDPENLTGILDPAIPANVVTALPRIREWDGWCQLSFEAGSWQFIDGRHAGRSFNSPGSAVRKAVISAGVLVLTIVDKEITLPLAGHNFLAGDYWLALVRRRAVENRRLQVLSATPIGIKHHYCILGVAKNDGDETIIKNLTSHDLRRLQHPSLTCLDAGDIGHKPDCGYLADVNKTTNVEEALEALCVKPAEFVPFDPQCDYLKNEKANNVAKALEALCTKSASFVPFEPQCEYLKNEKADNVAKALEALCKREANVQNLPKVIKTSWENDQPLRLKELLRGLEVTFSNQSLVREISTDTFILTIELPLPFNDNDIMPGAPMTIPRIVLGNVEQVSDDKVLFKTKPFIDNNSLNSYLGTLKKMDPDFAGIRCRVQVQGRSIWFKDKNGAEVNLDGFVPLESRNKNHFFKNAGIGHISNFESWFYLLPDLGLTPARFRVMLENSGRNQVSVIKIVRRVTGLGLKKAKDLVQGTMPVQVVTNLNRDQATRLIGELKENGAQAILRKI